MIIVIDHDDHIYDIDIHKDVCEIIYNRHGPTSFFSEDRFPRLKKIILGSCSYEISILKIVSASLEEFVSNQQDITQYILDCPNLKMLFVHNSKNLILSLNTPKLRFLSCSNNNMESLSLNCPKLEQLDIENNRLETVEMNCPRLKNMVCRGNPIKNLAFLESCPDLVEIVCPIGLEHSGELLQTYRQTHGQEELIIKYMKPLRY
jgi:Leucine-rich repeat (LRR) protein